MTKEKLYTAGEFADLAGVSLRTIRFYDSKGLLKPVSHSKAGYRYYNKESLLILQRIMMLKYLGFSLSQISDMLKTDQDVYMQLAQQKELLIQKKLHLDELISNIEILENSHKEEMWDILLHLLNLMSEEDVILEHYQTSEKLENRINIHAYSTGEEKWAKWVYRQMALKPNKMILELGCGNGLLWYENIDDLPEGIHLILTDRSEGMLDETRRQLASYERKLTEKKIQIDYQIMDANDLSLPFEKYDYIIANHMLYHVTRREECLRAVSRALKEEGKFFCSTVGEMHLKELNELAERFDSRIEVQSSNITKGFLLENGEVQLKKYFTIVDKMEHLSNLLVESEDAIYNYIYSFPGNASYILDQRGEEFKGMLRKRIEKEGAIFIRKSAGMFICRKG